jgi:tetratricopeptide (TPR) repeat protein
MPLLSSQASSRISSLSDQGRKEEVSRIKRMLADSTELSNQELIEAWIAIGKCYKFDKALQLSEEAYLKAIEVIQTLGDEKLLGEGYRDLGDAFEFCGSYARAITYYRRSAEIFDRLNEGKELVTTLSQMAWSYGAMGELQEGIRCLDLAIQHPATDPASKAMFVERIALSLGAAGEYRRAIEVYDQALAMYEAADFKRYWGRRLVNLAQFYSAIGDEEGARKTMERLGDHEIDEGM